MKVKLNYYFLIFNYHKAKIVAMHSMFIAYEKVKSMAIVSRTGRRN